MSNYPDNRKTYSGNPRAQEPRRQVTPVYYAGHIPQRSMPAKQSRKSANALPGNGGDGGGRRKWIRVAVILTGILIGLLAGYYGINLLRDQQVKQSIAPYRDVYGPNIFIKIGRAHV